MKNILKTVLISICLFACCFALGCTSPAAEPADKSIYVTLLDGEHYTVVGENKKTVNTGETVSFEVELDSGYTICGSFGDDCSYTKNMSNIQTVTVENVSHKSVVSLFTKQRGMKQYTVNYDGRFCDLEVLSSVYINEQNGIVTYVDGDDPIINIKSKSGYRYLGVSSDNYIAEGGDFVSYASSFRLSEINSYDTAYLNFKSVFDTTNTITYKMGDSTLIQDCDMVLRRYVRANTFTAVDLRERGIDCESKLLVGWTGDKGYIPLGSKVSLNNSGKSVTLSPVWKEYSDSSLFTLEGNKIVDFSAKSAREIVVPRVINGIEVNEIGENAFSGCAVERLYLPDTISTVEDNAFKDCVSLGTIYMSDTVMNIGDRSFCGCKNLTTLYLSAYIKPRCIDTPINFKAPVYDMLINDFDDNSTHVVALGGSSVMYGYDANTAVSRFEQAGYENVKFYNFGYHASIAGFVQYELMRPYIRKDDIFLHAPEPHHNNAWFGPTEQSPITGEHGIPLSIVYNAIYRLTEFDWSMISALSINKYCDFFSCFSEFNKLRMNMEEKEYANFYQDYSEGMSSVNPGECIKAENGEDKYWYPGYTFADPINAVANAKTLMYDNMVKDGINVFVTSSPFNRHSLLYFYGSEEDIKNAADVYTDAVKTGLDGSGVKLLLSQYETVYDGRLFSDSDLHLGDPFRDVHTAKVIDAILCRT